MSLTSLKKSQQKAIKDTPEVDIVNEDSNMEYALGCSL